MDLLLPSHLPLDVITTIIRRFKHLSTMAMHNVFGKMPYQWQLQIIWLSSFLDENYRRFHLPWRCPACPAHQWWQVLRV
jgi:hypothetical protein